MQLTVRKRSGACEPFERAKAIAGVRKACKGRPVTDDQLDCLGQTVEDALRADGWAEVPANEIGLAILQPLRELDEVAYLRFASVYRAFESAEDFITEIATLRESAPSDSTPSDSTPCEPASDEPAADGGVPAAVIPYDECVVPQPSAAARAG